MWSESAEALVVGPPDDDWRMSSNKETPGWTCPSLNLYHEVAADDDDCDDQNVEHLTWQCQMELLLKSVVPEAVAVMGGL